MVAVTDGDGWGSGFLWFLWIWICCGDDERDVSDHHDLADRFGGDSAENVRGNKGRIE